MPSFLPTKILTVDIDFQIPALVRHDNYKALDYFRALILVRLHLHPIGIVEVNIPENGVSESELACRIWDELEITIRNHFLADKLAAPEQLSKFGLKVKTIPLCVQRNQTLLVDAPFVSVVIATRDRLSSLQECIQSVLNLDYPRFDVVIVDNAPKSNSTESYIRSTFSNSKVRYLREDVPGLAIAHNRALIEVTAPIVAFTDDDVIVDRNWLKAMVLSFQSDPLVACVTGMILPFELETAAQQWIEDFGGFGKGCKHVTFHKNDAPSGDLLFPYSAGRFGSGASMAFRTSVLKKLGGFDSALGAGTLSKGGDDLAIFFEIISRYYRLAYEPAAVLFHRHRRDYQGLANQSFGYGVGLSAYLMKVVLDKPIRLMKIALIIPFGLKYLMDPRSPKNQKKQTDYPSELTFLELKGFLLGPLAYLRSRWVLRKMKKKLPVFDSDLK